MPRFVSRFQIRASLEAVSSFHASTLALKRLTPPPVFAQIHRAEPLAEGSEAEFTLWFGPLPVRWLAVHSLVDPASGFTDRQARGPMRSWVHRHAWTEVKPGLVEMEDCIDYEHHLGMRGLLTRLLFAPPLLKFMFAYRSWVIRRACGR
jgi:ligand-binding SRPBCC domain-containing protein